MNGYYETATIISLIYPLTSEKQVLIMKNYLAIAIALTLSCLPLANTAFSADEKLSVELKVFKLAKAKNKQKLVLLPAEKARPGDVLEYQALYKNTSKETLRNIQATLPIPAGMIYQAHTAKPKNMKKPLEASIDGIHFAKPPLKRTVTLSNGKQEVQNLPYSEYRFLRWDVGTLQAGESFTVQARVKVEASDPAETADLK